MALLLWLPVGCAKRGSSAELVVGVASSAAGAVQGIVDEWTAAGGKPVRVTSASSSTLALQIERGAPMDVLISADRAWVDRLVDAGRGLPASVTVLAENRLVLYRRADRGEGWGGMIGGRDPVAVGLALEPPLARLRWTTGDPGHVPLGRYAKVALTALGWWDALEPFLLPAPNARAAVRLVELGEADFGIGYATDVAGPDWVARPMAKGLSGPIEVTAVQVTDAGPGAAPFMEFLGGPVALDKLRAAGFTVPAAGAAGKDAR